MILGIFIYCCKQFYYIIFFLILTLLLFYNQHFIVCIMVFKTKSYYFHLIFIYLLIDIDNYILLSKRLRTIYLYIYTQYLTDTKLLKKSVFAMKTA